MSKVKGTIIASNARAIRQILGEEDYQRWLETLPEKSRKIYAAKILPSTWFEYEAASAIPLQLFVDKFHDGDHAKLWEVGRIAADLDLRGIYKLFVRIGTVSWLVRSCTSLTNTVYQGATVKVTDHGHGWATFYLEGIPDKTRRLEMVMMGWIERAIEISAKKTPGFEVLKSPASGDARLEIKVTWT